MERSHNLLIATLEERFTPKSPIDDCLIMVSVGARVSCLHHESGRGTPAFPKGSKVVGDLVYGARYFALEICAKIYSTVKLVPAGIELSLFLYRITNCSL